MKGEINTAGIGEKDSLRDTILKLYERSDESKRMDMYMMYRDMRESFSKNNFPNRFKKTSGQTDIATRR